jgi:hypothetical protein
MPHLTREDITMTLGDLDDASIAEIIDSGAGADELALAATLAQDGEVYFDHTSSGRVIGVCEVIEPFLGEPEYEYESELPFTD